MSVSGWSTFASGSSTPCKLHRGFWFRSTSCWVTLSGFVLNVRSAGTQVTDLLIFDVRDVLFVEFERGRRLRITWLPGAYSSEVGRDSSYCRSSGKFRMVTLSFDSAEIAGELRSLLLSIARPDLTNEAGSQGPARPLLVIVNPYGGRMRGWWVWTMKFRPLLNRAGRAYKEITTSGRGHISAICENLEISSFSGVAIVGGDGSFAEAVNGLLANKNSRAFHLPLGLVPAGSSNALAKARGIFSAELAAFLIIKGAVCNLDLIKIEQLPAAHAEEAVPHAEEKVPAYAICAVSLGFLSDVNALAQGPCMRRFFGPARYGFCGALRVCFGGSIASYKARVTVQEGLTASPRSGPTTGSWDVFSPELWSRGPKRSKIAGPGLVLVTHQNSMRLLHFLSRFARERLEDTLVEGSFQISSRIDIIQIEPIGDNSVPFSIDGELYKCRDGLQLSVKKDACMMFGVPTQTEQLNFT